METNELPIEPSNYRAIKMADSNEISPESGVYTEGGLVFVPDSDSQGHSNRNLRFDLDIL